MELPEKVREAWRHPYLKEREVQHTAYELICLISESADAGVTVENLANKLLVRGTDEFFGRFIEPILSDRDTYIKTVAYLVNKFELSPKIAEIRKQIAEEGYKYFCELGEVLKELRKLKECWGVRHGHR